ncbi:MAG: four helix bundle protein [Bacteroidota bacterium]
MIRTHKDLEVWKLSMGLVTDVYKLTSLFPKEELYGLTRQIRESAVSVPSNISEGAARQTTKEFIHFLYYATGSLSELETQLLISKELGFATSVEGILNLILKEKNLLSRLILKLKNKKSIS